MMPKELNQIKNQRYEFVRIKLLVSYWEKLSLIKEIELDYFTDENDHKTTSRYLSERGVYLGRSIQRDIIIRRNELSAETFSDCIRLICVDKIMQIL